MAKYNPSRVTWTPTAQWTNNDPFTEADFAGYEWAISAPDANDGWTPLVSVPVTFNTTELDIALLDIPPNKEWELGMRTIAKNGAVSDYAVAAETVIFDQRVPQPPLALSVV